MFVSFATRLFTNLCQLEQSGVSRRDSTGRVHELEVALEDNRRRLSEERKHKENYEDLLKALRSEMLQHKNERDNLRDEIVPALRAQVEGLEAEASEYQTLVYENARMQQELNALKMGRSPVGPIAEDGFTGRKMGLTRSSSVMRGTTTLSRSNSVSNKGPQESRESLADRVKDIEAQRDALHRALKSLLDRQRFQTREHEKRVKVLEQERDVALDASSPRRRGFEQEVGDLRYELNELRRRADEALEQKWQCEKGLGGLKKDLDRSEQETASLRTLLVVNEIVVPDNLPTEPLDASLANSATLEKAYRELREAQSQSITRLRELNGITPSASEDDKTVETMNKLLQTMSKAEAERDLAQKQAESFRAQAESLQDISFYHEGENENMAGQLHASAQRIDVLSSQVKRQLTQNSELRERLAIAIGTGEREQKVSSTRIAQLQERLRELEDKIMNAQQRSEDSVHSHEEDVREINIAKQSSHTRLHRLKTNGMGMRSPNSPLSPMIRSPRLDKTTSGQGKSMSEAAQTEALQAKVRELESALKEADLEMGEVVQRMTKAQMEVMELQSARDEADMKTRALQNQIRAENDAVGSLTRNMS
jgi:chromosome segregation ATPase